MTTDTTAFGATWITVDPAIAQVPLGHFLLVDMLTALGSPARRHRLPGEALAGERAVAWGCRHVGNYLRHGVLLPGYGQI